jgi:Fic family protein
MDWELYDQEGTMRQRYLAIDERVLDVRDYLEHGKHRVQDFEEMYDISWIYHENGLEGVVLTYPEIKSAIDNKIISDVSLINTYKDLRNQKHCLNKIKEYVAAKKPILLADIHEFYRCLSQQPQLTKHYRRDIPIHRTYFHEIVAPQHIEAKLEACLEYLNQEHEAELHPVEFAANVHHRFMSVFPFPQYSGFIGRLLLSYVLLMHGGFLAIIHTSERQRYYETLRNGEVDFRLFLTESLENSLGNTLKFFQQSYGRARSSGA